MSWPGISADRKIRAGFWLLTVLAIVLGILAVHNALGLVAASQDVARTNEAIRQLETFLSRLKDVEVAEREYILTGDERYVDELVTARADVDKRLDALPQLRSDRHWMALLRSLVPEKFEEIQKAVDLRRAGDVEAASNSLMANRGAQPMDDIRRVLRNMIQEESRLLGARSDDQDRRFVATMTVFGFVLLLNLVLTWSLFHTVRREARKVRRLNEELEGRVALRTQELERSNEELQQFAYIASHDLKEPMRMISSYASLLQRRFQQQLGDDADTYIGFIVEGVKRMNALIADLLSYSRAGQPVNCDTPIDPGPVLDSVLENLSVAIQDSGASVTRDPLPPVVYDPVRLGQLLQNLIGNAIKYRSERNPLIHVGVQTKDHEIVFYVRDNGIGIPSEHQSDIFGIFTRLHGKEVEGTGIGLATCKKIVEHHGGRIWVESSPGRGSTFRFTVPRRERKARIAGMS